MAPRPAAVTLTCLLLVSGPVRAQTAAFEQASPVEAAAPADQPPVSDAPMEAAPEAPKFAPRSLSPAVGLVPPLAFYQSPAQSAISTLLPGSFKAAALFAAGAATAFFAHETCHVMVNLMLGSHPYFSKVNFHGIPFFSITPSVSCLPSGCYNQGSGTPWAPGPRGMYAIVSAGYQCQQIGNEIILSTDPNLRYKEAPFRKGVLAFNIALSMGYAIANWVGTEPNAGDSAYLDLLTRHHLPPGVIAAAIFMPAIIDAIRFFAPESWLPWLSRLSKTALIGLVLAV
jgi:hypothetical protein